MSKTFDFEKERCAANAMIRHTKVTHPFVFPEWQRIQNAVDKIREANKELELAQAAWDRLGQDNFNKEEHGK
jgi:hypothetical protein